MLHGRRSIRLTLTRVIESLASFEQRILQRVEVRKRDLRFGAQVRSGLHGTQFAGSEGLGDPYSIRRHRAVDGASERLREGYTWEVDA